MPPKFNKQYTSLYVLSNNNQLKIEEIFNLSSVTYTLIKKKKITFDFH